MKKVFTLPTCKTCQRIFDELQPEANGCEVVDIKFSGIEAGDLDRMAELIGSYEALFSRRAIKFRTLGLAQKQLQESDYRQLILEEYTFLKRPVFFLGDQVMAGSAKASVAAAASAMKG